MDFSESNEEYYCPQDSALITFPPPKPIIESQSTFS